MFFVWFNEQIRMTGDNGDKAPRIRGGGRGDQNRGAKTRPGVLGFVFACSLSYE